jgi:hypothetical protein
MSRGVVCGATSAGGKTRTRSSFAENVIPNDKVYAKYQNSTALTGDCHERFPLSVSCPRGWLVDRR